MVENAKVQVTMSEQEKAWVNPPKPAVETPANGEPKVLPKMTPLKENEPEPEGEPETPEKITPPENAQEEPEMQTIDIETQVKPIKDDMTRLETYASRLTKLAETYKKQIDGGDQSAVQSYNEVVKEYNDIAKEYGEREKMAVGIQEKGQAVICSRRCLTIHPKNLKGSIKSLLRRL
jgi:hypothetical protein